MLLEQWLGGSDTRPRLDRLARLSFALAIADGLDDLAHDLRSPLQNLATMLSLLESAAGDAAAIDPAKRLLDGANTKVERLLGGFAMPPTGDGTTGLLSLRHAVERVETLWPVTQAFRGCRLEVELPKGIPAVIGNGDALVNTLLPLLVNAAEAAPSGARGQVRVSAEVGQRQVWLAIADNGPGLPDDLEALCKFGYSTKDGLRHLGVGLVLARELVARMQGHLELRDGGALGGAEARIGLPRWDT